MRSFAHWAPLSAMLVLAAVQVEAQSLRPEKPRFATLYITADDRYRVWLNGHLIGSGGDWRRLDKYPIAIASGDVLAIFAADNNRGDRSAGLDCCIVINDTKVSLGTDITWKCSTRSQKEDWYEKGAKVAALSAMSKDNVPSDKLERVSEYKNMYDQALRGRYVWSKEPSTAIYVQKTIDLKEFK